MAAASTKRTVRMVGSLRRWTARQVPCTCTDGLNGQKVAMGTKPPELEAVGRAMRGELAKTSREVEQEGVDNGTRHRVLIGDGTSVRPASLEAAMAKIQRSAAGLVEHT